MSTTIQTDPYWTVAEHLDDHTIVRLTGRQALALISAAENAAAVEECDRSVLSDAVAELVAGLS